MFRLRFAARPEADAPHPAGAARRGRAVEEDRRAALGAPVRAGALQCPFDMLVAGLHEERGGILHLHDVSRAGVHTDVRGMPRISEWPASVGPGVRMRRLRHNKTTQGPTAFP